MPSRPGRTGHSLRTSDLRSHRRPELPVRKTDLVERGAPSTYQRDAAICGIFSFIFGAPRVTASTSQGVLLNDRYSHPIAGGMIKSQIALYAQHDDNAEPHPSETWRDVADLAVAVLLSRCFG